MGEQIKLALQVFGAVLGLLSLIAAIYNIATSYSRAKKLAQERHDSERLDKVVLLATVTEQRVTGLEGRHNSLEARVDRRLDQIGGDIAKVKDLFTEYIIKNH